MGSENEVYKSFLGIQKFEKVGENILRSQGPHIVGEVFKNRVYGGQTVTQSYLVTKDLFQDRILSKVETNFIGPPTTLLPLDFIPEKLNEDFSTVIIKQSDKIVTKSFLRFNESSDALLTEVYDSHEELKDVHQPSFYMEINEFVKMPNYKKDHSKMHRGFLQSVIDLKMFEVRPVNYEEIKSLNEVYVMNWCRLIPEIRTLGYIDPVMYVLLLTDWMINEHLYTISENLKIYKNIRYSSLNHKVWFHSYDFDTKGYLLYAVHNHVVAKKHVLISGKVYDETKKCVATIVQDAYIEEID